MSKAEEAIKKLEEEKEKIKNVQFPNEKRQIWLIKEDVFLQLKAFCEQSEEFCKAILSSEKTFEECMTDVVKNVRYVISDLDAYTKAVRFYLPEAEIKCKMEIVTKSDKVISVSFADYL